MLTLFGPEVGVPIAIIDATGITEMRTSAVTALGDKVFGRIGAHYIMGPVTGTIDGNNMVWPHLSAMCSRVCLYVFAEADIVSSR